MKGEESESRMLKPFILMFSRQQELCAMEDRLPLPSAVTTAVVPELIGQVLSVRLCTLPVATQTQAS